ncbi:gustatory receptor for bitter taste 93a [Musca vetustissima]|uniref:gustatory receptor for bitter taste 93a n=1 Tax=Musca vetustissima TaxID=27455 RepID=UPI002AB71A4C|nr:gustatory receptor for bitter taste 93a [Musca vetustissima]
MKDIESMSRQREPSRTQRYTLWILLGIFNYGRFLDIINCRWDARQMQLLPVNKFYKTATSIFRVFIVIVYWDVVPDVLNSFLNKPKGFVNLFSMFQVTSVVVFSVGLFLMKVRDSFKIMQLINRFVKLNVRVAELSHHRFTLCKKSISLFVLKTVITLLGYINEMPHILEVQGLNINSSVNIVIGVYLWLGSMYVLDACYLGFLMLALMYRNLGNHLQVMLNSMQHIEGGSHVGGTLTTYNRMKQLCDYSEKLDNLGSVYTHLYQITKDFVNIFQWNILYYIYYNFMVIFLLLNHCIWQYIRSNFIDFTEIMFVFVKIANLVLMIMCANDTVDKSEMVNQLNLDIVCSDIDARWDTSVESFLSQRKVENLEIKVFGFFTLNNEFILMMLSAIITYLFFIIQFGMSGGFGTSSIAD